MQICNAIPKKVCELGYIGTNIHTESIKICTNFKLLFFKYSKCHNLMNSCEYFNDEKIAELGKKICLICLKKSQQQYHMLLFIFIFFFISDTNIKDLMAYIRSTFPKTSITPKLHMLEEHVVDFVKKWKMGLGLYGEQGGESIHPEFNSLKATYASVRPHQARVKVMLEQHHLKVMPASKQLVPPIKRKKKDNL